MKNDNGHWYDGRFFDIFIAPNQDRVFSYIRNIVTRNSTILDIGCGTGRMAFQLADRCSRIEGVDASLKNIDLAQRKMAHRPGHALSFHHADALDYLAQNPPHFDFAVLSYVIHEMDERKRPGLLRSLAGTADKIIMVDYMVPRPPGIRTIFDELVEFVAGRENYRDFRSFVDGNGLTGLVETAGLKVIQEVRSANCPAHILVTCGKS